MKKASFFALSLLLCLCILSSSTAEEILEPVLPVPDYVTWLLDTARGELGYKEDKGYTKYGEWAGDPYCQWCAEFLCWCVDQTEKKHGVPLLNTVFPLYSGSNTGRAWFIKNGRFAVRSGEVEGWGYEWLRGEKEFLKTGSYIPQPGDYMFFSWTSGEDTDHVALVEYCSREENGVILVHVIEGNNPSSVARNAYELTNSRILGYGIVHGELVDITMRFGNNGVKVHELQDRLNYIGYLNNEYITGNYGNATVASVRQFQADHGLRQNGIANNETQLALREEWERVRNEDPAVWTVVDEDE